MIQLRWKYSSLLGLVLPLLCACGKQPAVVNHYAPRPADAKLTRGPVFIDAATSSAATIVIRGRLPTPCHQLRLEQTPAGIDAWSVSDPAQVCAQMLQPFTAVLAVTPNARLTVNGQPVSR